MSQKTTQQYMVTLRDMAGLPVSFWVSSLSERAAVLRARRLMGEPGPLLEVKLREHPKQDHAA